MLVPLGDGDGATSWSVTAPDGREVAVFRLDDGSLRAVQGRCPHNGGPLAEGRVRAADDALAHPSVTCPWHWYRFSLETGQCVTTSCEALARYPVVEHDGALHAEMPLPPTPLSWSERLRAHARSDPTGP